ncbi:hypothetical protein ABG768_004140, partial [Culter alburnus]
GYEQVLYLSPRVPRAKPATAYRSAPGWRQCCQRVLVKPRRRGGRGGPYGDVGCGKPVD